MRRCCAPTSRRLVAARFGATVGVHTAEAMFVKHMAFMKVKFRLKYPKVFNLEYLGCIFRNSALDVVVSNFMVRSTIDETHGQLSTEGKTKLRITENH